MSVKIYKEGDPSAQQVSHVIRRFEKEDDRLIGEEESWLPITSAYRLLEDSAEDEVIREEISKRQRQDLQDIIGRLPENKQKIVRMHFEQGMDLEEIADAMKMTRFRAQDLLMQTLSTIRVAAQITGIKPGD